MGTEWERDGNGVGVRTGTPFRDKPPPPPPRCLEVARLLNSPLSTHPFGTTGGGGVAYLERVCPSPLPPHSHPVPTPFPQPLHSRQASLPGVLFRAIFNISALASEHVICPSQRSLSSSVSCSTLLWLIIFFGIFISRNVFILKLCLK